MVAYWFAQLENHPYAAQAKCSTRNLESFDEFITGLAVVLLCDRLQDLIIQDLRSTIAEIIKKGKTTQHELLEPMPRGAFIHSITSKCLVSLST